MSQSIKISGYKCFPKDSFHGFEKIEPINVIIGKNNSGKSSLTDIVKSYIDPTNAPQGSSLTLEDIITEADIQGLGLTTSGGTIPGSTHYNYLQTFIGKKIKYKRTTGRDFSIIEPAFIPGATIYLNVIVGRIYDRGVLLGKFIRRVNAERDIKPEEQGIGDAVQNINGNGEFSTQLLRQLFHENRVGVVSDLGDLSKIKQDFFKQLNEIIKPDIDFIDVTTKQATGSNQWEIYFETRDNKFIPLSQMGSGMKTILLVLINLIIKPKVDGKSNGNYVFILEELENNLHPAMQRRLYDFIKKYSEDNNGCYFFITTHSNIVIDVFGKYQRSQILHITNTNGISEVKSILDTAGQKQILEDLDFRASDLLQTNGIIWVEGPSDRIYLNKWISLKFPDLKEGIHYTIMFYGGRLLSHLSFRDIEGSVADNFIELLKINKNAYVMIDKDGKRATDKLNATKQRIETELGVNKCWVTDGIEIENYLSVEILKKWLSEKYSYSGPITFYKFDKIQTKIPSSIGIQYEKNKVKYSSEIINYINLSDIERDRQLQIRIETIGNLIKKWNNLN